jgi:drug/metabolite transporter (DMT)-like permease
MPLRGAAVGMAWMVASGLLFIALTTVTRVLAQELPPWQTQCLRFAAGLLVMVPWILRRGIASFRPAQPMGHVWRGAIHSAALLIWFYAIPFVPIAETTAIGFTAPLFVLIGAALFLKERVDAVRWGATALGFAGVLVVVAPQLAGAGSWYAGLMLASAPLFAVSFLITKALTRRDVPEVIVVWQAIAVCVFSLPFAIPGWVWPNATQWALFLLAGLLGSAGHFALTTAFKCTDVSALQPIRFVDLLWAALFGLVVFGDIPAATTIAGGVVILAATTWIARHEARAKHAAPGGG